MQALSLLTDPNAWAALVTLTVLEIVLGIDNLVFISVLTSRLAEDKARRARLVGLALAFIFRVIMLAALTWLIGLAAPLFQLWYWICVCLASIVKVSTTANWSFIKRG